MVHLFVGLWSPRMAKISLFGGCNERHNHEVSLEPPQIAADCNASRYDLMPGSQRERAKCPALHQSAPFAKFRGSGRHSFHSDGERDWLLQYRDGSMEWHCAS